MKKWLEIIRIQSTQRIDMSRIEELCTAASAELINPPEYLRGIESYRSEHIEGDFSIHLIWELSETGPHKSHLGHLISSSLRSFGLTDHTVWRCFS
jgi:hypothetical protein